MDIFKGHLRVLEEDDGREEEVVEMMTREDGTVQVDAGDLTGLLALVDLTVTLVASAKNMLAERNIYIEDSLLTALCVGAVESSIQAHLRKRSR